MKHAKHTAEVLDYATGNGWALANADCVPFARSLPDNCIDMGVESPPFSKLYTYSDSARDMGNSRDDSEFFGHYRFLIREQFRILRPGRIWAVHCKNLVDYQGSEEEGRSGLRDFRGDIIRAYQDAGFKLASEVTIWKSAPEERNKTNAHGLLYRTITGTRGPDGERDNQGDSTFCRMGLPDYMLFFRKWPRNAAEEAAVVPVRHTVDEMPLELWRQVASPVWVQFAGLGADGASLLDINGEVLRVGFHVPSEDIRVTDTLNVREARDANDEAHMCPLQLPVIRRSVHLYSNPGDVVMSSFAGIGSEGVGAMTVTDGAGRVKPRRFIGCELKPKYFTTGARNLRENEPHAVGKTLDLFARDLVA
jgi:DNA modification methylase